MTQYVGGVLSTWVDTYKIPRYLMTYTVSYTFYMHLGSPQLDP